jgi:hypothetical protein
MRMVLKDDCNDLITSARITNKVMSATRPEKVASIASLKRIFLGLSGVPWTRGMRILLGRHSGVFRNQPRGAAKNFSHGDLRTPNVDVSFLTTFFTPSAYFFAAACNHAPYEAYILGAPYLLVRAPGGAAPRPSPGSATALIGPSKIGLL